MPCPTDHLRACLADFAEVFDARFAALLEPADDVPAELAEAMRYSALAPGKRLRPYLVTRCCELAGGTREAAWPAAAALECVHAFSLIHDDLPAMDDDDLRRGRPTCHKQFGEALAILAGDALLALAFELVVRDAPEAVAAALVCELARGTGWSGMIGGQTADVLGEAKPADLPLTRYIHARKTGALFVTACRVGALVGGGPPTLADALGAYALDLGHAFQIADDLLDVTSTAEKMGKNVGKDAQQGKQTFPRCVGVEAGRDAARQAAADAVARLSALPAEADDLRTLAGYAADRNY